MIEAGRNSQLLLTLIIFAILYIANLQAKKGKMFKIRDMPPIAAMEESVSRAAESELPVHYSPGYALGGLTSKRSAALLAGISILGYVARLCVQKGARLIVTVSSPESIPLVEEQVKTAYMLEGEGNIVQPGTIRWISSEQYAFQSGAMAIIQHERPAANFLIGPFSSESINLAQAGQNVGAMTIAGSDCQIQYFIAASDYMLIGEELYAAQALLSGDIEQTASIAGEDYNRILLVIISIIILIAVNSGFNILKILEM